MFQNLQSISAMKMQIRELRQKKGLKQYELADAAGISRPYIAAIESPHIGKSPSTNTLVAIARVLGVRVGDLFDDARTIPIVGKVGANTQIPSTDKWMENDSINRVICPSELPYNTDIIGVEIGDDSMLPIYQNGDILFYFHDIFGVPSNIMGTICICKDTNSNVYIKHIKPGSEPGKFHLISLNTLGDNMFDIRLEWAAKVCLAWPRNLVRYV